MGSVTDHLYKILQIIMAIIKESYLNEVDYQEGEETNLEKLFRHDASWLA